MPSSRFMKTGCDAARGAMHSPASKRPPIDWYSRSSRTPAGFGLCSTARKSSLFTVKSAIEHRGMGARRCISGEWESGESRLGFGRRAHW